MVDVRSSLEPGAVVGGRYRIGSLLAAGGMAEVYRAADERLGRDVALKILSGTTATEHARFRREVDVLAHLDHPNLVRLYDAGELEGSARPFLVLELVDGSTLAERLAVGPLPAPVAARIGHELAGALAVAHASGVVHRDVKPSNVLIDVDGRARLTDFGVAHDAAASTLTDIDAVPGTAAYMAPEQVRGEHATTAIDVYALGLVVLECCTGTRAFPGTLHESALSRLTARPDVPDTLATPLRDALAAMTALDPADRPTAAEAALAFALASETSRPDTAPPAAVTTPAASAPTTLAGAAPTMAAPLAAVVSPTPVRAVKPRPRRVILAIALITLMAAAVVIGVVGGGDGLDRPPTTPVVSTSLPQPSTAPTTTPPAVVTTTPAPVVAPGPECPSGKGKGKGAAKKQDAGACD
ncbi:MAG TPA: protein kinase [Acidimicrobiia bacterium]|nr:protein kinase [Acidimicrobiia bacterium]